MRPYASSRRLAPESYRSTLSNLRPGFHNRRAPLSTLSSGRLSSPGKLARVPDGRRGAGRLAGMGFQKTTPARDWRALALGRRAFLAGAAALLTPGVARAAVDPAEALRKAVERIAAIEARQGGRLGVAVLDSASGASLTHRADERFPMCSTFKLLAAAAVLARVDAGVDWLDRRLTYGP